MENKVAKVLKTLAKIWGVLILLGSVITSYFFGWWLVSLLLILGGAIVAFVSALIPYAFGEVIQLLQDIKNNTLFLNGIKDTVNNSAAVAPVLDESIPKL
jgi:hypothetical protein